MRAVVQRVRRASVTVEGIVVSQIGPGLLVLLGVGEGDDDGTARRMADKVAGLRIFEDAEGKMNLDTAAVGASVLCVSQFTLYGDVRRGRRPSFDRAAGSETAAPLYEAFCSGIEARGIPCGRGVFGAEMQVELVNDGPVTLILDSADLERPRQT
jgi:D-tyrosyl-tRNA(Tyr) deacylase